METIYDHADSQRYRELAIARLTDAEIADLQTARDALWRFSFSIAAHATEEQQHMRDEANDLAPGLADYMNASGDYQRLEVGNRWRKMLGFSEMEEILHIHMVTRPDFHLE